MPLVFGLCAAYALYCLVTNPAGPITTPDSFHYLNMTPIVPLGYPVFLKLTGANGATVIQPVLFSAALALLGREIVHTTRRTWLALGVMAGCMVVPQIRDYHASILSESLFLTLLVVFLAFSVRFGYYPTWRLMVVISVTVGVAILVRRTGFAFVPIMLVMALLNRQHLRTDFARPATRGNSLDMPRLGTRLHLLFVAAIAPCAVIVGTEQVFAPIVHAEASSLMGRHMFAKAALIEAPPAPPSEDPIRRALDAQLETHLAPIRAMLAGAPGNVRGVLTIYYETCLQGGCADEARASTKAENEAQQTELMGAAGTARIRRAPLRFLELAWLHYRSLWTVNRLRHPDTAPALNQFLAAHRPLPYEHYALALGPDRTLTFEASPPVRYAQWAISVVAAATGALALAGLVAALGGRRLPPALGVACVSALTLHAGLWLTALLAAGFTRFLLGLWPAIIVSAGFAVHSAGLRVQSKFGVKS